MAGITWNPTAYNRFITRTVQPYLRKKAQDIAEEAARRAPIGATGELRDSISVIPSRTGVRVVINAGYAGFVHQGTGPQGNPPRPNYYPRLRRRGLIMWSDSKNLNAQNVAHGIAQRGTAPNPFFKEAIDHVLGPFNLKWINTDLET